MSGRLIIPEKVKRAVANGRTLRGVREYAELRPDGNWEMKIGPSSPLRYAPWEGRQTADQRMNSVTEGPHMFQFKEDEAKPVEIPAEAVQAMKDSLPAIVRKSANEKYQQLCQNLFRDAMKFFKGGDGQIVWPESVLREMDVLAKGMGKDTLVRQTQEIARRFIVKAAREQQAQDAKSVTRGWSGHLSA
jgi:hypothetical protein